MLNVSKREIVPGEQRKKGGARKERSRGHLRELSARCAESTCAEMEKQNKKVKDCVYS